MDLAWLKTLAPTVATALGGPLAGLAVEAVSKALGVDSDKIEDTLQAGKLTGDQVLALKQAELDLQAKEKEFGFKFAELDVQDRKDARGMQTATRSRVPAALSAIVTIGYFSILGVMLAGQAAKLADSQALLLMLGSLSTAWGMVMSFWFGSSSGSAEKTALLAKAQPIK